MTDSIRTTDPHKLPLLIAAAIQLRQAVRYGNAMNLAFGCLVLLPLLHQNPGLHRYERLIILIEMHVVGLICLIVGILCKQRLLIGIAAVIAFSMAIAVVIAKDHSVYLPASLRTAYSGLIVAMSLLMVLRFRQWAFLPAGLVSIWFLLWVAGRTAWNTIREVKGWEGLVFYTAGLAWLIIAVIMSWWKSRHLNSVARRFP